MSYKIVCSMVRSKLASPHQRLIAIIMTLFQTTGIINLRALHAARRKLQVESGENGNTRYLPVDRRKHLI